MIPFFRLLFLICCLLIQKPAFPQRTWTGDWIGPHAANDSNSWVCYRQTIHLGTVPRLALTQISTDSKYWLAINGRLIVREGQLKRGPNPRDTYYDELDIAPYLHAGNNKISILTWYWGKNGFSHQSSGQTALLFESEALHLFSDSNWRVSPQPAYYSISGTQPNFRLAETNIGFDARKNRDWINGSATGWDKAVSFGKPPTGPWNHLVKRPIPFWKDFGLKNYTDFRSSEDGQTLIAKLPYNAQVNPYFKIVAPAGLIVDIRTDNYLTDGRKDLASVRTEYITKSGEQEFECPGWMNGHNVLYHMPKGIRVLALKYRETGYATSFAGHFSCDDPMLNALWKKAQRTLYLNMRDNYFDCPDRERAQWWGDAELEIGQSFYALDTFSSLLSRKAIQNLIDWQRPDSSLFSPIPAGNWSKELPLQTLAGIYGIGVYFRYTGDTILIRQIYPALNNYLALWKQGVDSLVIHRPGGWDWADWGKNIDVPLLDNAWYVLALQTVSKMAYLSGDTASGMMMVRKADAIGKTFDKEFWRGDAYRSDFRKGLTDERGQALAVLAGIVPKERYPQLKGLFDTTSNASPYMEKYVLEALYKMNEPEAALKRMKRRYHKMITDPGSTLWELFNREDGGTDNHAWSGGPLTILSQFAAGVAPEQPGYSVYHIFPQMGDLNEIHSVQQTVKGDIRIDLLRTYRQFQASTTILPDSRAIIGIPAAKGDRMNTISVNGKTIWRHGIFDVAAQDLVYLGQKEGYIQFSVRTPGTYLFLAEF